MNENYYENNNSSGASRERGSRPLLVIGIILLNISLFLAAFVLSFSLIVNPIGQRDEEVRALTEENTKLKNDTQLLKDQIDVVQSELETYQKQYGSSKSRSSSIDDDDDDSSSRSSRSRYYDDDDDDDDDE